MRTMCGSYRKTEQFDNHDKIFRSHFIGYLSTSRERYAMQHMTKGMYMTGTYSVLCDAVIFNGR